MECYEAFHVDEFTTLLQGVSLDGVDMMTNSLCFGNAFSVRGCNFAVSVSVSINHALRLHATRKPTHPVPPAVI